jgi:predicted DNA-binding mobile mystery protein A
MANRKGHPALARKQLDRRLDRLRNAGELVRPPRGWIRAIRDALGMTTAQLAHRIGVSQPRIVGLERSEMEDRVTLGTLRQAADAMDCELVYGLVPKEPLETLVRKRAYELASTRLARTAHTMTLENQSVDAQDLEAERQRQIDQLLNGDPSRLWDAP